MTEEQAEFSIAFYTTVAADTTLIQNRLNLCTEVYFVLFTA
jgi:hypothetical protein